MATEETQLINLSNDQGEMRMISTSVICRLCANQSEKLIGLFSEDGLTNDLVGKMNSYLPITVSETDTLPLQCCWQCASILLDWHDLVVASVEADKRLKSYHYVQTKTFTEVISMPDEGEMVEGVSNDETLAATESIKNDTHFDAQLISVDSGCPTDGLIDIIAPEEELTKPEDLYTFECSPIFVSPQPLEVKQDTTVDEPVKIKRKKQKHLSYIKQPPSKIDPNKIEKAKFEVEGKTFYKCSECGKCLYSVYTFKYHLRIHSGERPYMCNICNKNFRVPQGLVRHLNETHKGIKKFDCDICGRFFATRRNVEEHRRIHTNEHPYICGVCGKAFKQKASLFVHNRCHSTEFPFCCTACPLKMRTKRALQVHMTRHTGERPFSCETCGRNFRLKYELKRHTLIHSEDKPFVCNLCEQSFRQKRYLRNHLKLNHHVANPTGMLQEWYGATAM